MAAEVGLTQSAVSRIWRAFGLQPHRQETWKLSKDPLFIDKVRDVVGLYLNPPERAVVLCVDEKSQIQALDRTAPILPMLPGTPSAPPTTTSAPAPRASTPRWTSPPARSSARCTAATARSSSRSSCSHHRPPRSPTTWTCISCSTTAPRTRRRRSSAGWPPTPASCCTSRRPPARWLNLVERWFAELTTKKLQARRAPLGPRAQRRHPRLDRDLERRTPGPSSGPRPPTRSSNPSPATAHESTTHDTSPGSNRSTPPCG